MNRNTVAVENRPMILYMGHRIPHIKSSIKYHKKTILSDTEILEIKVWNVPVTGRTPDGVIYSMVYLKIINGTYRRIIGFDNREGKGHHKHLMGHEEDLIYIGWKELVNRFLRVVDEYRGDIE